MFKSKYIFTFILITFILLSICGAGIFLDDEWVSAQQLKQIAIGHQITTNEGNYGYYSNGTSGNYFNFRDNRLMYSMALPIISLPIYEFIKLTGDDIRVYIIIFWTLLGLLSLLYLYIKEYINKKILTAGLGLLFILSCVNIFLYNKFITTSIFSPTEILAITLTNIILYGLFASVLHKIIDLMFVDNNKLKLFTFVSVLSCSSLLFWSTTCKDHILSVLIGIIIIYYLIKFEQNKSMSALGLAAFLTGLLLWVRIEYGIGLGIGIGIYLLFYHYKEIINNIIILSSLFIAGTLPLWINNYITTNSIFIHPFMLATARFATEISYEDQMLIFTLGEELRSNIPYAIFKLLLSPGSGAIGLIILIPLVILLIPIIIKRIQLSKIEIMLLLLSFTSVIYYIVIGSVTMSIDTGIVPDIRYFVVFYTPMILFTISVLSKTFNDLKYKKMLIYYILFTGLIIILLTAYSATISEDGTYRDVNRIINTVSAILMGIGLIATINDIRLNTKYLNYIIPIMIAIPMSWQIIMTFIYHTSKANTYPMFIPITEFIYNYIFGLIL